MEVFETIANYTKSMPIKLLIDIYQYFTFLLYLKATTMFYLTTFFNIQSQPLLTYLAARTTTDTSF